MDGTGLSFLAPETVGSYILLQEGVASSGGRFAYLTTVDGYDQAKLQVIDIAHPANNKTIPLFSSDEADIDARRAVVEQPSFAWSHDGEQLAFFGVMDGPSSDLYVYSTKDDQITRLTSGPSQGYQPSWSPDDQYIVHSGADSFRHRRRLQHGRCVGSCRRRQRCAQPTRCREILPMKSSSAGATTIPF